MEKISEKKRQADLFLADHEPLLEKKPREKFAGIKKAVNGVRSREFTLGGEIAGVVAGADTRHC